MEAQERGEVIDARGGGGETQNGGLILGKEGRHLFLWDGKG